MWHVVRRPREELHDAWKAALRESLSVCAQQHAALARLVFMHLSWYQPDTTQYFSPVSVSYLKATAESAGCDIRHVVILIDDVYDMYARLQGPHDIYKPETIAARADRLHGLHRRSESDAASRQHSKLEAVESALAQLISWRQHEILQAEDIARELDAHFTVMGVKHSRLAFDSLVRSDVPHNTYLSHRISEVRRMNKEKSDLPDVPGEWSAVVDEVNDLHSEFAHAGQVLINPTAIDELRFAGSELDKLRQPLLARRWAINKPYEAMLWASGEEDYEHTTLLSRELELPDDVASSVARSLANRIYFDVAFRDHVIVEHTPGLCVYRPFFQAAAPSGNEGVTQEPIGANWSGGVRPEIVHWYRKTTSVQAARRRVAFVHTREEIRARIVWLRDADSGDFTDTMLSHLPDLLVEHGISKTDADALCQEILETLRSTPGGSHLEQDPIQPPVQLSEPIRSNRGALLGALRVAYQLAMTHAFTLLPRPSETDGNSAGFDVLVTLGNEAAGGDRVLNDLNAVARRLHLFFSGQLAEDDRRAEEIQFWRLHEEEFAKLVQTDPIEFCCRRLRLPHGYLTQSAEVA